MLVSGGFMLLGLFDQRNHRKVLNAEPQQTG